MYVKTKFQKPYERNAIILSRIKQDIPFYEIAAEFGMSVSELSDFAEAETENEKLKHNLELKNSIIQLHEQGKKYDEIAELKKISLSVINKTLSDYFQRNANPERVSRVAGKYKCMKINPGKFSSNVHQRQKKKS